MDHLLPAKDWTIAVQKKYRLQVLERLVFKMISSFRQICDAWLEIIRIFERMSPVWFENLYSSLRKNLISEKYIPEKGTNKRTWALKSGMQVFCRDAQMHCQQHVPITWFFSSVEMHQDQENNNKYSTSLQTFTCNAVYLYIRNFIRLNGATWFQQRQKTKKLS